MKTLSILMFIKRLSLFVLMISVLSLNFVFSATRLSSDDVQELYQNADQALSSNSVKKIKAKIEEHLPKIAAAKNQDITVFLGNTGAGKSTMVNILSGIVLAEGAFGTLELPAGTAGLTMSIGCDSVTQCPQSLNSPSLGLLFDMPGFKDTNGTVTDLINAALMKSLLENARSVRVVMVMSQSEVEALRAAGYAGLSERMKIFSQSFRQSSILLLVNQLLPSMLADLRAWLTRYPIKDTTAKDLLNTDKVLGVPRTAPINRNEIESKIRMLTPRNVSNDLMIQMALDSEA